MKRLLFFFYALGIFQSSSAQSGIYHPFPESNASWNQYYEKWACQFSIYPHAEKYSYVIGGDTTIGANVYHRLARPNVQQLDTCWGNNPMNIIGYAGCFRQDTAARKVFYVVPGASTEEVLYDFSLNVGDTVTSFLTSLLVSCAPDPTIVASIDSVLIDGSYRKRWEWKYDAWYSTYVVEGIGSLSGLLEAACSVIDGPFTALTCARQDNDVIYSSASYPDTACAIIDEVKTLTFRETGISASFAPNPFHDKSVLTVRGNEFGLQNFKLTVFNSLGALVREDEIPVRNAVIFSREYLSAGLYYYELSSGDNCQITTGKFEIE
jgi:hypothetical protein